MRSPHLLRNFLAVATVAIGVAGASLAPAPWHAAIFDGGGLEGGIDEAAEIQGPIQGTDIQAVIIEIVVTVLDFVALIAVVVIIIDGVRLIISMGKDEEVEKVRKSIFHVVIGLIVILLARAIVMFVINILQ